MGGGSRGGRRGLVEQAVDGGGLAAANGAHHEDRDGEVKGLVGALGALGGLDRLRGACARRVRDLNPLRRVHPAVKASPA